MNIDWNTIKTKIYNNLFWILVLIGMFLLYMATWNVYNLYWQDIFEKVGLSVLSSGVFAAVLKSLQFSGIFKKEIADIVLSTDFLEKRNDLPELWKRISKGIYQKKFSEISDEIENVVLGAYFPTKYQYYYKDFRYTLNIEELSDDDIIKFTQTISHQVVLQNGVKQANIEHSFVIDKQEGFELLKNKKEYIKIDGVDILKDVDAVSTENEFETKTVYNISIDEKSRFLLETKESREYSMRDDNYKVIRVNTFTKGMDVSVSYPSNMLISFFNIGVIEKFERNHVEHDNRLSRVHKEGLILPFQGFGITFARK